MRRFHWTEISGEKDCPQCACLGETSILKRDINLLQGNDAAVKFTCEVCGFKSFGIVAVDGSDDPTPSVHKPSHKTQFNLPSIPDPLAVDPKPAPDYKPPKTDEEAVQMAFGKLTDADEFVQLVTEMFDEAVEIGDPGQPGYWKAVRNVTPTHIRMGSIETVDVQVEFIHATQGSVFTRSYPSTAGLPDVDKELADLKNSCLFVARPPTPSRSVPNRAGAPAGPVGIVPGAWGQGSAGVLPDSDPTRQRLLSAFRGGG